MLGNILFISFSKQTKYEICFLLLFHYFEGKPKRSLFSIRHVIEAIVTTFKKRKGPNRMFVLLTISVFIWTNMPFFGEWNVAYLYVQKRYGWEVAEYSQYRTITLSVALVGMQIELTINTEKWGRFISL